MSKNFISICLLLVIILGASFFIFKISNSRQNSDTKTVVKKKPVAVDDVAKQEKFVLPPEDNIVFIVVDTLRADFLPFYGYDINTAPFLNELAAKSVMFENAFSASSSTAPAMASIFTATYPSQHGVLMGMHASKRLQKKLETLTLNRIPRDFATLGGLMAAAGFKTYGVADNLNIDEPIGFLDGFEQFETFQYEGATNLNKVALSYYEDLKDSKYFLYLHYMDPHAPYNRWEPWFDKAHKNVHIAAYNSEIRHTDEHIRVIFDKYNFMENSLIVFLSDHGEELGDHKKYGHGKSLYPEVIKVPLMIYHRNLQPGRVAQPVNTIDVLPTLADLLGAKLMPYWEGESLRPYFENNKLTKMRTLYAQLLGPKEFVRDSFQSAVDQESWLYIDSIDQGRKELFNLSIDPLAFQNLISEQPEKATILEQSIAELLKKNIISNFEAVDIEMNQETADKLKTLGYF